MYDLSCHGLRRVAVALAALFLVATVAGFAATPAQAEPGSGPAGPPRAPAPLGTRVVTDMAGRRVSLPARIRRVATIGSVPVINTFLFALGEGHTIVNGLPDFARKPRWKYQTVFAPTMSGRPSLQGANREPDIERLLAARPDVVFTMDRPSVDILERHGIKVIFLYWREPEDVKEAMRLVGQVFGREDRAAEYIRYFDTILEEVRRRTSAVAPEARPRVLYFAVKTLTQPHLIAEWWIEAAGGVSVTNNGRTTESFAFSPEQLLAWNPDVLTVSQPGEIEQVYRDLRFQGLKAVVHRRVYTTPMGAHLWAQRTVEQPLTVLWAAKTFYPELFADVDLERAVQDFYARFFGHRLSEEEVREILSGDVS